MSNKTLGLTTGQAARYCLVSPDTIGKWIKDDRLRAQRTMGGQYRIFVDDLREFMIANGMSTERLDEELDHRPFCWEYRREHRQPGEASSDVCETCPVRRAKALDCFALRALGVEGPWREADCQECDYYRKWCGQAEAGDPARQHRG